MSQLLPILAKVFQVKPKLSSIANFQKIPCCNLSLIKSTRIFKQNNEENFNNTQFENNMPVVLPALIQEFPNAHDETLNSNFD